ncbi:hypothetical protein B0T14DRAFT_324214 [Immersiella caudata]|uniref:Uncharacterized protein n=1 Tax=Immersiella caudata TaxID=314043 RepID=A0AA39WA64_9PEZI|nr:hypothetical protein B0T14DRAFT_324214 [Immersiella caudata]
MQLKLISFASLVFVAGAWAAPVPFSVEPLALRSTRPGSPGAILGPLDGKEVERPFVIRQDNMLTGHCCQIPTVPTPELARRDPFEGLFSVNSLPGSGRESGVDERVNSEPVSVTARVQGKGGVDINVLQPPSDE